MISTITDIETIRTALPWAPLPTNLRANAPACDWGSGPGWSLGHDVQVRYEVWPNLPAPTGTLHLQRGKRCVVIERTDTQMWAVYVRGLRGQSRWRAHNSIVSAVIYAVGDTSPLAEDLLSRLADVVSAIEGRQREAATNG